MNGHKCDAGNGGGDDTRVQLKVGLLNHQGRYLTAETFGSKINASGAVMRKKQIWYIEQDRTEEDTVYIKRYMNMNKRYMNIHMNINQRYMNIHMNINKRFMNIHMIVNKRYNGT